MPTLRSRPSRGDPPSPQHHRRTPSTRKPKASAAASMPADAIEVRESIEAMPGADDDVMADADVEMADADAHSDADSDADADGEPDEQAGVSSRDVKDMLQLAETTAQFLSNYEEDGLELAAGFQRIPNKRQLPDYFDVIKAPIAFSTIRWKIVKKTYTDFGQFVRDVAQICHNAQVYNRPSAPIFGAAVRLREIFQQKLREHVDSGKIRPDEAELPDLGEIPMEESPAPEEGDQDAQGKQDDSDSLTDSDSNLETDLDDDSDYDARRRSGPPPPKKIRRPLRALTAEQGRIHTILKALRKLENDEGEERILPFEELPDKTELPDYYTTIRHPIAMDLIKKKQRRRRYQSVDQAMADLELMFENAKTYNEDDSAVFEDAVELQKLARSVAEQQRKRPDDEFRDPDGKLALPSIEYRGELWKPGDWVHLANPNDPRKPVVAQIFTPWQDPAGHQLVNVCWYYRPEQTVHRFDKHFYETEVFRGSRFRDHRIEEVVDRCFVLPVARFARGRPKGFPAGKWVYVCESQYDEERFRFAKIADWARCLPDEVRAVEHELDPFPAARTMRKVPSPIKHLLREDAKESDQLPKPTWGSPNAPPMIGAVHRRPRAANESPPPEPSLPTHVPTHMPIDPSRRPSIKGDIAMAGTPTYSPAAPPAGPPPNPMHYVQQFAPPRPTATPTPAAPPQGHHLQPMPPQVPTPQQQLQHSPHYPPHAYPQQYAPQQMLPAAAGGAAYHHMPSPAAPPQYDQGRSPAVMTPPRAPTMSGGPPAVASLPPHANSQQYSMAPRAYEVFRIQDPELEASIPQQVREQFHRDDAGRLLFFTAASREPPRTRLADEYRGLGHSAAYLSSIHGLRAERRRKRKERDEARAQEAKRVAVAGEEEKIGKTDVVDQSGRMLVRDLVAWAEDLDRETAAMEQELSGWSEVKRASDEERRARVAVL